MKKALILALAFSAGVWVSAVKVREGAHLNGVHFNGLVENGIIDNGIIDNGISGTYLDFTTISHRGLGK